MQNDKKNLQPLDQHKIFSSQFKKIRQKRRKKRMQNTKPKKGPPTSPPTSNLKKDTKRKGLKKRKGNNMTQNDKKKRLSNGPSNIKYLCVNP